MKKFIIAGAIILFGLLSFFVGADTFSNPEFYKGSIEVLNDKQTEVMTLTAASAAASTALSAIPGDAGTPIANQVAEISKYLFFVTCIVFLEKYLLTVMGFVVCKFFIPAACILLAVYMFNDCRNVRNMAIKIAVSGMLCLSVVPLSVMITDLVEKTNNIDISSIEEIATEETEEDKGWLGFFDDLVDNTTKLPEKAKETVVDLVDNVAVMVVTSCVIPILVMLSYFFIIKEVFKFDIIPHPPHKKRIKHQE